MKIEEIPLDHPDHIEHALVIMSLVEGRIRDVLLVHGVEPTERLVSDIEDIVYDALTGVPDGRDCI